MKAWFRKGVLVGGIWLLSIIMALLAVVPALGEGCQVAEENIGHFKDLLVTLAQAYETPSGGDGLVIESELEAIRAVSGADYEIARAIADHWNTVYLDPDGTYPFYLYHGDGQAAELEASAIADSDTHAFVVLGFELQDGEMADELKGRCEAAAAAARAYPSALIICSGGATGQNNPHQHTEAGLMKAYLVEVCGIDPSRIHIDERAMTTVDNALNTYAIMQAQGIKTMTVITSAYHQQRGQAIYNAVGALYRRDWGYSVEIVANYSYDMETPERYRHDDRAAVSQIASVLGLPEETVKAIRKAF